MIDKSDLVKKSAFFTRAEHKASFDIYWVQLTGVSTNKYKKQMKKTTNLRSKNWKIKLAKLIAKTWTDEKFRASFLAEPAAMLRKTGMMLQDGIKVVVKEGGSSSAVLAQTDNGNVWEINLPSKPDDLDAEQLYAWFDNSSLSARGGSSGFCHSTHSCCT